jgi:hypothetical protein
VPDLTNQRITRVCFDYGVTLLTDAGYELRISTELMLTTGAADPLRIDPEASTTAAPLLTLLHDEVLATEIAPSGSLLLRFSAGRTLRVEPHPRYEAWTLAGRDGPLAVCSPGGGLVTWDP